MPIIFKSADSATATTVASKVTVGADANGNLYQKTNDGRVARLANPFLSAKTANYTASFGETVLVDTSAGSFNVTLPAPTEIGYVSIGDIAGQVADDPLTVKRSDGTTLVVLSSPYTFVRFYCVSALDNDWIQLGIPASSVTIDPAEGLFGGVGNVLAALQNAEAAIDSLVPDPVGHPDEFLKSNGSAYFFSPGGGTYIENSASLTFGSVPANSTAELSIALTGVMPSEPVVLSVFGTVPSGIMFNTFKVDNNVVTIRCANVTTGAITVGSLLYTVRRYN